MTDIRRDFYENTSAALLSLMLPPKFLSAAGADLLARTYLWEAGADLLARTYIDIAGSLKTQATLEIGAHEATFSKRIKERYQDGVTAFAFEASPSTFGRYRHDAELLGVKYMNAAVSNENGNLRFFEYRTNAGGTPLGLSSLYLRRTADLGMAKKTAISVKALSGDAFIRAQCPDMENIGLWIDVEGAQAEVLAGFSDTFAKKLVSSIFIEVESVRLWPKQKFLDNDLIARMGELGFSPLARDVNYGLTQFNIIFIRNDCLSGPIYALAESYIRQCRVLVESYIRQCRALGLLPDNPPVP